MPVTTKKKNRKWRIVEVNSGKIAKNSAGTALDGGGHPTKEKALAQVRAINASLARRKKKTNG